MKNLAPYIAAISLVFASCTSNENEVINEQPQEKLLKSYTLKRDGSGAYSIDFNVAKNTDVATLKTNGNTNDIVLSKSNTTSKTSYSNEFSIENDQLKIGFIEADAGKRTKILVEDDNITFARESITEFLNSYSITANEDGTYQLNFKVNDNVATEFVYNEEIETYEVHLSTGDTKQVEFSRQIEMTSEDVLKIDFVNHKYSGKTEEETTDRKPRSIIINGVTA